MYLEILNIFLWAFVIFLLGVVIGILWKLSSEIEEVLEKEIGEIIKQLE